jgi:hypothetical protein
MSLHFLRVLIAIDQLFNAILGGYPDETISSRAAKAELRGDKWGCVLCKLLAYVDKNHCEKVIERDEGKRISEVYKPKKPS